MIKSIRRINFRSIIMFIALNLINLTLYAADLSNLFYSNENSCVLEIKNNEISQLSLNEELADLNLLKEFHTEEEFFKFNFTPESYNTNINQDAIKRCDSLKKLRQAHHYISLALQPAIYVSPFIQSEIKSFLYSYGIVTTNPTVLAATIIGITGITTVNILLTIEFEKCNQLDHGQLKQEIIRTLEAKYNLKPAGQVDLIIKNKN